MKRLFLTLLTLLIVACGTFEVGVEPTVPRPTPTSELTVTNEPTVTVAIVDPTQTTAVNDATQVVPEPSATMTAIPEVTATPAPIENTPLPELTDPTATPAPIGGVPETPVPLHVTYLKDGNLWVWTEAGGARLVYDDPNTDLESAEISPTAEQIAYVRDGVLWQVTTTGEHNVELTPPFNLASIHDAPGVRVYRYGWLPASRTLLYNTSPPPSDGPGFFVSDNLLALTLQSSGNVNEILLENGAGGMFYPSPDGSQIAVVRPGQIDVIASDGSNKRTVFTHSQILTYSEAPYYVQPVWSADSTRLFIALPPTAALEDPNPETEIWQVSADGALQQRMGTVAFAALHAGAVVSPNTMQVAYLAPASGDASTKVLAFALLEDATIGDSLITDVIVEELGQWSPDGQHIIFTPKFDGSPQRMVATVDGTTLIGLGAADWPSESGAQTIVDAQWVDAENLIVVRQNATGQWEIVLRHLTNGDVAILDSVAGRPPSFDLVGKR